MRHDQDNYPNRNSHHESELDIILVLAGWVLLALVCVGYLVY